MCRRGGLHLSDFNDVGSGQIWLDDVQCTGYEHSLAECRHNGWGVHNCNHGEDVLIICATGKCSTSTLFRLNTPKKLQIYILSLCHINIVFFIIFIIIFIFKAHQHKAAGKKSWIDIQKLKWLQWRFTP